jgi:hypothetical protein
MKKRRMLSYATTTNKNSLLKSKKRQEDKKTIIDMGNRFEGTIKGQSRWLMGMGNVGKGGYMQHAHCSAKCRHFCPDAQSEKKRDQTSDGKARSVAYLSSRGTEKAETQLSRL